VNSFFTPPPLLSRLPLGLSAASLFVLAQLFATTTARPQSPPGREDLHGVLSRGPLRPPLRNADVLLRYSPDGRGLLIQNPSGAYLFSRDPLALRVHISTEGVYPARFSSDSQEITIIGHGLRLNREKFPGGPSLVQDELPFHDGCLDAELAPGADFFACLTPTFNLVIYRLSTGEPFFSTPLAQSNLPNRVVYIPIDKEIAFPSPFGFLLANGWEEMTNRGMKFLSMNFSPAGKVLLVRNESDAFTVDLTTRRKTSLPGGLHKRLQASFALQNDDSVLIAPGEKEAQPAIASLRTGTVTGNPSFKADRVWIATNPRYAILSGTGGPGVRVFDLEQNHDLEVPNNLSVDVFGNEMAVLNDLGELFIYHLGEKFPFLSADLPLDLLPVLRAAAVTPALDRIAFSVDGNSAAFQLPTGARTFTGPRFSAANFSDQASTYFLLPRDRNNNPERMLRLAPGSKTAEIVWTGGKDRIHSGGTTLLEYALANPIRRRFDVTGQNDVPYALRGLDPATGKELWKREFFEDSPIPFADPQGDRLVLGWDAQDLHAQAAAKRIPSVWEVFKRAKISKLDSYFEIVDALSGNSVGGVLVQVGSGPESYDAAFSAGNTLFLIKDGKRVSGYSLQDGSLKTRLVGGIPTASVQSNLFAMEQGPGHLSIYDLATGAKLDEEIFAEPIAYTHFSAEGNRLLVLTRHQVAYVLDVSAARKSPPAAPAPPSR
jgi:hypothetical protein